MEQNMKALERANEVNELRRDLLRDIKARRISVADLLRGDIPDWVGRMTMHALITAQARFPERRFRIVMDAADAGLARLVGEMTDRQLQIVCEHLDEWEKAHPTEVAA